VEKVLVLDKGNIRQAIPEGRKILTKTENELYYVAG